MKIRSKQLWQYLNERGLLNATQDEILLAKKEYTRMYKKEWKSRQTRPQKEIRPLFTIREYLDIVIKAKELGLKPTSFVKQIAISAIALKHIVPESQTLLHVMQLLTMCVTSGLYHKIPEAESLLLGYIKKHCL